MSWSGGVYSRGYASWSNDAASNLPISATKFDLEDNDFAGGLNNCITKDGLSIPTSPLTWGLTSGQILALTRGSDGTVLSVARTAGSNNPALQFQVTDGSGVTLNLSSAQTLTLAIQATAGLSLAAATATLNSSTTTALAVAGTAVVLATATAITLAQPVTNGLVVGAPTGGSKGANTINSPLANTYLDGTAFQAITPTWSGLHIFTGGVEIGSPTGGSKGANTINSPLAGTYLDGTLFQGISPTWTANHIFSAASGVGVTINGVANSVTLRINGNSTSGQSLGVLLEAGTTSADYALFVTNQTGAHNYLKIIGDGSFNLGYNTSGSTVTGSANGAVTINTISGTALSVQVNGTNIFQAIGTVAPTLKGYGPIAAGLVDLTPDTGTFTITYTGFTAATTGTAVWARIGNLVILFLPAATGTSNATTMTATGIPNAINPARAQIMGLLPNQVGEDNGVGVNIAVTVNSNNTLTFGNGSSGGAFTGSGTKGIVNPASISYLLN